MYLLGDMNMVEMGQISISKDHNGLFAKATLDEIAKELNMSTTNLKRVLRIERNLTDSMKELRVYYVLIISCVKILRQIYLV